MPQKFSNVARALLTAPITATDTSLTIELAKADLFPAATTGTDPVNTVGKDWFKVVLQNDLGIIEIVYVRTRTLGSATLSNLLRGQEGTTAISWSAGAVVGLRLTATDLNQALELSSQATDAGKALVFASSSDEQIYALGASTAGKNIMKADDAADQAELLLPAVSDALRKGRGSFYTTTGTSTAYTLDTTPDVTAYVAGLSLDVVFHVECGDNPTLQIDGVSTPPNLVYQKPDGTFVNITNGMITAGHVSRVFFLSPTQALVEILPPRSLVGFISYFASRTAPSGYLKCNGAAISRAVYADLFAVLVRQDIATISFSSPGVFTWNNHGLSANDTVILKTTGALPTGLTAGTTYYVVGTSITTNTFQLSETPGGASIDTSGSQSGVHTAVNAPFGDGDGSTTFNVPDLRGEFLRGWDGGRGIDVDRAYGSIQLDAFQGHQHTYTYLSSAGVRSGGPGGTPFTDTPLPTTAIVTDGTNGTPRVATETRPRNVALLACIKY